MGARSSLSWSCFTKLHDKVTSFLSGGGLLCLALFSFVMVVLYNGSMGACLLSSFLLFSTKYVRYFMAIW